MTQVEREDRRITQAATERLRTSLYRPLRVVHCECNGGVLTLAGRVPSFYHRQLAHAHVRDLAGVQRVVDQLQVVS
jgi:osmotically-inducible protein OsmY